MPIYGYYCEECDEESECFLNLEQLDKAVVCCGTCNREAKRQISACNGGDASDYARERMPLTGKYDESLNKTFYGMRDKEKYLKEKGLVAVPEGVHGVKKRKNTKYFS